MVYIPYPRIDLDQHPDLLKWRAMDDKKEGDWKLLKFAYLPASANYIDGVHMVPKCWYSELPQGDQFAQDVEHFRPKNEASPLNASQKKELEKAAGVPFLQAADKTDYEWLEFDYRNYRFVTAFTNRGGGKHVYFPLVQGTRPLATNQLPWKTREYPYLLDPANAWDAQQLWVSASGKIEPIAPKTPVTQADIAGLPKTWHNDSFSYIRAMATIQLYRLNERILIDGRAEVYRDLLSKMNFLQIALTDSNGKISRMALALMGDLVKMVLPSAPFALAARCALLSYIPPKNIDPAISAALSNIPKQIMNRLDGVVASKAVDWSRA